MLTLLMLAAATPSAAARTPVSPCQARTVMTKDDATVRARPLTDMPPATQIQTVLRMTGRGCADLAVVRKGVGAPGR